MILHVGQDTHIRNGEAAGSVNLFELLFGIRNSVGYEVTGILLVNPWGHARCPV